MIDQIDLVPTLSYFFGLPIPKNNLGKPIIEFYRSGKSISLFVFVFIFTCFDLDSILVALDSHAIQLGQLLSKLIPEVSRQMTESLEKEGIVGYHYQQAKKLHDLYKQTLSETSKQEAIHHYYTVRNRFYHKKKNIL